MIRQDPSLNTGNYDPRERPWYQDAVKAGQLIVTAPYVSVTMQKLVGLTLVLLVFSALLTATFKYLFADLGRVAHALHDIAHGEGDLTVHINTHSKDEVGQLAQSLNQFVARLHGIVSRLRDVTVELAAQSRTQASGAQARSQRVRQQQDEIVMVATAVTEMASATQEIAGQSQVGQSQRSITGLADEVADASQVINELDSHAQKISDILATISGIAEQTNLLALNDSTDEIQQMIETLQQKGQPAGCPLLFHDWLKESV